MKANRLFLFLMLVAAAGLWSCSDTEVIDNGSVSVGSGLTISDTYLDGVTVSSTGATLTISAQSSSAVSASSSESWCTVSVGTMSSTLKVTPVTVTVAANTDTSDRTATVTISAGGESETITITQTATDGLIVSTTSYTVSAEGETITVNISANGDYECTPNNTWITSVSSRASMADYTEQFLVDANPASSERTGTISITLGSLAETVTVTQEAAASSDMTATAHDIANAIYAGINIGNTMECTSYEGAWSGATVNSTYIAALADAGFNAVRIPCAWDTYITDDAYTIDSTWLDRVEEVVTMCISNGMYVLLNAHWDNGWLEDNIFDASLEESILAEQTAIWTQVAEKLAGFDEHLIFAACNEPGMNETNSGYSWTDETAIDRLISYEQAMIDAVRATGGNNALRCIAVQGLGTDISNTYTYMNSLPTDEAEDRLLVEVHFYEPYQFCLMEEDASWGNVFWYWGEDNHVDGSDHNPTWGEEDWVLSQFAKMTEKFVDAGYPCIIGEFGADIRTVTENQDMHDASVSYYGEVVTREAKNAGCIPFYWETGSVFNRTTGAIKRQDIVDGIMAGAEAGSYPF